MSAGMPIKLVRDRDGQVLHIPRGFEMPGDDVVLRQEGPRLVIEPDSPGKMSLADLLASWEPIEEEIGPIEDVPVKPIDL